MAVDPYIPDGEVPSVEHVVLLLMLGVAIVPVAPVGAGLAPGDAISVAPKGIPVGETAPFVVRPSGEVAPIVGVGLAIPLICAMAALEITNAGRTAAINENFMSSLHLSTALPPTSISFATNSLGSDIG